MPNRVLETVLTGRNLLSPVLATAGRDVAAFNSTVARANTEAGTSAATAAEVQRAASGQVVAANTRSAESTITSAARQTSAHRGVIDSATALAVAENASSSAVVSANTRIAGAVDGTTATYQRSAASLREKLGLQALDGEAANRSAAANSRAAQSAAVFAGAVDSENVALSRETITTGANTRATVENTAARQQASLAARAQQSATGALAAFNGLLGTSLTPLTAGLGATGLALAYAGYRGMEFGTAMSQVQAASQETGTTLDSMRDAAIDAGAKTQYSAVEAAQGITEMSKAGVSAADILGGGLTGALNLAAAGQISVAEAAETGATALSVFNLKGDQMSHVADLLAAGAGKAQGSVGDMSAALNQSALVAAQAGLSIEDTAGALAMFASNGLIGSDAGTSFKTMLQALTPNSEKAAAVMEAMGLSAFDAGGNFVGLETYAGQLQTALAGMTEEQRNSTLETIFGSDAVRAASILYKEGSTGVAEWAGKVNDAGYAQRQAAQLTDNLRGDLERLGGAFDSAMTSIGGGTQGALREAVQALTAIINVGGDVIGFFTSLPGPVQAGLLAMASLAALRGPLDGLFTRLAAGIVSTVTGMGMATGATTAFGIAAGAARTAVMGLLTTAAPLAAVAALAYGVTEIIRFTQAGDDAKAMVENLDKAIEDADGNEPRFQNTSSGIDELRDKIAELKPEVDSWAKENRSLFERAFIPVTSGAQDARESLEIYQDQLEELEGAQDRYGQNIDVLSEHYRISRDDVIAFADAHGIDLSGSLQIAQGDFMRLAGASIASGDAMVNGKTTAEDYQAGLEGVSQGASDAKTQIDLLKTSLDVLTGANTTLSQAEAAVYDAMAQATDAIKENGGAVLDQAGALNLQTENGRAALDVLLGYTDSANNQIGVLEQQGQTFEQVQAKDAELRQGFIDTAARMGITGQAAIDLANKYYGLPEDRTTTITADTKQATDAAAALQQQIDNMRGREIVLTTYINEITRRSTMPDLNGSGSGNGRPGAAAGGQIVPGGVRRDGGGPVFGPGGPTEDLVPAVGPNGLQYRLSNGEWVIKTSSVEQYTRQHGAGFMAAFNAGHLDQALGYSLPTYNAAGTGFTAAPAAMPGYAPAGVGGPGGIDYDRMAAAIVRALPEGGPLVAIGNYSETPAGPRDLAQELRYQLTAKGR